MDILACPIDKFFPLELFELNMRKENDGTRENDDSVIEEGILFCNQCRRFFPIIDEIPILLPDELRNGDKDLKFIEKWRGKIPNRIISNSRPYQI